MKKLLLSILKFLRKGLIFKFIVFQTTLLVPKFFQQTKQLVFKLEMEEVLLKVTPRASQTSAGTDRVRRRATVMVGDQAGDIGFGQKTKRTETLAKMGATGKAYRKRFHIVLESWDLQNIHTVPFYVIGFHDFTQELGYTSSQHAKELESTVPPQELKLLLSRVRS